MAKQQPIYDARGEQQLMLELWDPRLADDPREFVRFVFPWGKVGTPLEHVKGPRNWQDEEFKVISDYIKSSRTHQQIHQQVPAMYKAAIASGRGPGKSAFFGMLSHWLATTRIGGSVWVTANGEPQLKTKTFPEIAKWFSLSINSHWWELLATKIEPAEWLSKAVLRDLKIDAGYWYVAAQLWSEENPDAFAGAHNQYGECYLFDEASGIPAPIWTVAEGVFTEQIIDRYWLAFSNPRRPSGAFFECFHKNRDKWRTRNIDSRTVDGLAMDAYQSIIDQYGPDSDEAKIEVYGQFPSKGENQFISRITTNQALTREIPNDPGAPLVMGVDVARFGEDRSVIAFRKGRDAKTIPWQTYRGMDTVQLAGQVADSAGKYNVSAIFVDGGGVGGGVVDQLKAMGYKVIEVQSGESPQNKDKYTNKRGEMWDRMKEWLATGCIPDLPGILDDLCNIEYSYSLTNQIKLERKDELKKRGFASPDLADALALTFAQPVARIDQRVSRNNPQTRNRVARGMDYAMFGD